MRFFKNIISFTALFIYTGVLHSQESSISRTKMNVIVRGIDNPIKVVVENHDCEDVIVKTTKGQIFETEEACKYILRTDSSRGYELWLIVGVKKDGQSVWLDSIKHRVKRIPDPVVYVAGRTGASVISKSDLLDPNEIRSELYCFDFDLNIQVTRYKFETKSEGDELLSMEVIGSEITKEVKDKIRKIPPGQKVYFTEIKAKMPNNTMRELPPISLKLED